MGTYKLTLYLRKMATVKTSNPNVAVLTDLLTELLKNWNFCKTESVETEPVETEPVECLNDLLLKLKLPLSDTILADQVLMLLDYFNARSHGSLQQTLFFAAKVVMTDTRFSQERRDRLTPPINRLMGL